MMELIPKHLERFSHGVGYIQSGRQSILGSRATVAQIAKMISCRQVLLSCIQRIVAALALPCLYPYKESECIGIAISD